MKTDHMAASIAVIRSDALLLELQVREAGTDQKWDDFCIRRLKEVREHVDRSIALATRLKQQKTRSQMIHTEEANDI